MLTHDLLHISKRTICAPRNLSILFDLMILSMSPLFFPCRNKVTYMMMKDPAYYILLLLLLLMSSCPAATFSGPSVRVGFMTWHKESADPNLAATLPYFLDGILAAAKGINDEGGIHGRELEVVMCDVAYQQASIQECMTNLTQTPRMMALLPILSDFSFGWVLAAARSSGLLLASPLIGIVHPFEKSFYITRADTRLQLLSLIKMAVNEGHNKRLGLVWSNNSGIGSNSLGEAHTILQALGMELVGTYSVDFYLSGFKWKDAAYAAFLATRPQAIIFICPPSQSAGEFLVDVLSKSALRLGGVDPKLQILSFDQMSSGIPIVLNTLKLLNILFDPTGRIFVAMSNPLLTDARYDASRHAFADMTNLYNGSISFASNNIGYQLIAMMSWIAVRTLAAALRSVQPGNMTRASLKDQIFDTSIYSIDDLVIGPFAGPCSGVRAELGVACECNTGYHIVEMYGFNKTDLVAVEAARATTPLTKCTSGAEPVTLPLVYLAAHPRDALSSSAAASMLLGVVAQEATNSSAIHSSLEVVTGANTSALVSNISAFAAEKYLSLIIASVVQDVGTALADAARGGLPLIDPLVFPAALATPSFEVNVLLVSATLQQELHGLCQLCAANRWPLFVVARGPRGSSIISTAQMSAITFGFSLSGSLTIEAESPLQLPTHGTGGALLVTGLSASADVAAVANLLGRNPFVHVLVSMSELSVLYDAFITLIPPVDLDRVIFATSLPPWNSSAFTPAGYLTQVTPSSRSPLSLRGYVASAVVQQVVGQMNSQAIIPENFLRAWYLLSVIAIAGADSVGPYSNATCSSKTEIYCATNNGARVVRTMSVASAANSSGAFLSDTFFSSGQVVYQPLPTSITAFPTTIVASVAAAGSIVVVLALALWRGYITRRNNSFAPKDAERPFALCFTDIQSSTSLWARVPEEMAVGLEAHHALIRSLIVKHNGYEVKTIGDSFMIAFKEVHDAVSLAVELQRLFLSYDWGTPAFDQTYRELELEKAAGDDGEAPPTAELPSSAYAMMWCGLRVRIGIHFGLGDIKYDEITKGYDYYGTVANIAARTESSGHGGQIVVTRAVIEALPDEASALRGQTIFLGPVELRGVPYPVDIFQVNAVPGRQFPALVVHQPNAEDDDEAVAGGKGTEHDDTTEVSSDSRSETTQGGVVAGGASFRYGPSREWETLGRRYIALMLSTSTPDSRGKMLREMCSRWRIDIPPDAKHAKHLIDDPYVAAIARWLAPIMLKS